MSMVDASIRDSLYEKAGPKTQKYIRAATGFALAALGILLILIVRQF